MASTLSFILEDSCGASAKPRKGRRVPDRVEWPEPLTDAERKWLRDTVVKSSGEIRELCKDPNKAQTLVRAAQWKVVREVYGSATKAPRYSALRSRLGDRGFSDAMSEATVRILDGLMDTERSRGQTFWTRNSTEVVWDKASKRMRRQVVGTTKRFPNGISLSYIVACAGNQAGRSQFGRDWASMGKMVTIDPHTGIRTPAEHGREHFRKIDADIRKDRAASVWGNDQYLPTEAELCPDADPDAVRNVFGELSPNDKAIVQCLGRGLTPKQTANELGVVVQTVYNRINTLQEMVY